MFPTASGNPQVDGDDVVRLVRYGMDCYGYALLAAGQVDLVISGLDLASLRTPGAVEALVDELRYELESNSLRSSRDPDLA